MNNTLVPGETLIVDGLAPLTDNVIVAVGEPPLLPPPEGLDGDDPQPGIIAASATIAINVCF
jgi:hypothetical protein